MSILHSKVVSGVQVGPPEECWPWTRGTNGNGYGTLYDENKKKWYAHRAAYVTWVGPLGPGQYALHSCDNPICCNPAHLRAGTAADNTRDMVVRGRARGGGLQGEAHGMHKLTDGQILSMRRRHAEFMRGLATEFNTEISNVYLIVKSKTWKHLAAE